MAVIVERRYSEAIHPFHAIVLAGVIPLFLGALLSDVAYYRSYEIQWANFASWLIAGALVFTGIALVLAIIDLFRIRPRARGSVAYVVLVLATWVVGFLNALMHARDAWAAMPSGLILSAVTLVLALVAVWVGFCTPRIGARS